MKLRDKTVHMIGIGGIGMSAIARILIGKGCRVTGSDVRENEIIKGLKNRCSAITIGHRASSVGAQDLVVYSSSIRPRNPEIMEARRNGIPVIPRIRLLEMLMGEKEKSIAVTGTHGKTTITAMVSHLLEKAGCDPTVLIGGEHAFFGGNAKFGKSEYLAAELDESDGMFAKLRIPYLIIPNLEREHAEHYRNESELFGAFRRFLSAQDESSLLIYSKDERALGKIIPAFKGKKISYGFSKGADFRAARLRISGLRSEFTCFRNGRKIGRLRISVPGRHNAANALAAAALGCALGIKMPLIKKAMGEYRGVKRRFEPVGSARGVKIIEDYAHHPTEIKSTLAAAKNLNPRRIITVFQPHSYSRTKAFTPEFSRSFDSSDRLVLTDIYAAGEDRIKNVSTENIFRAIEKRRPGFAVYLKKENIPYFIAREAGKGDLVLVMGAGDINQCAGEMLAMIRGRRESRSEPLAKRTTLGIGGACESWVEPRNTGDLKKILSCANNENNKIFVMGKGSNVLAPDSGFKGIVIRLASAAFRKISIKGSLVKAGGGALLARLVEETTQKGLGGLEGLAGIPGTVGGAIYMNSSYKSSVSDFLIDVRAMDKKTGRVKVIKKRNIRFGYRNSGLGKYIILGASFRLKKARPRDLIGRKKAFLRERKKTQPAHEKSAGCVFRNPAGKKSAAFYIEHAGLKGKRLGRLQVSKKHANYIVASKGASSRDFLKLMQFIQKRVHKKYGIRLKPEIIVI